MGSALVSISSRQTVEADVSSPLRERSATGMVLLGVGLLAIALNLRIGVVSVPPELNVIEADLGISPSIAGLLTTIPVVAYGIFAFCTPRLTRAIGLHRLLGVAVLLIAVGIAMRLQPSLVSLFGGTLIVGAAIAIGNVLMPAAIKQDFSHRVGLMMGLYTTTMSLGAAMAAGLTVPLQTITGGGWRLPLALWAIPAVLAFAIWVPQMLRSPGRNAPGDAADAPSEAGEPSFRALLTDRIALAVTAAMGIQGMSYYAILTWVPSLLRDHGASAHQAGWLLAFSNFPSILASLVTPALARRCRPTWIPIAVVVTLCGLGFLALAVAPIALAYPAMVVLGLGQGAGLTLALCTIVWRSPDAQHTAHVSTMAQGFGYLFGGLGPLAFGLLHTLTGGWNVPLLALGLLLVVQMIVGVAASRERYVLESPA
jgi:CP family cyanate transporter-like MFS transporter